MTWERGSKPLTVSYIINDFVLNATYISMIFSKDLAFFVPVNLGFKDFFPIFCSRKSQVIIPVHLKFRMFSLYLKSFRFRANVEIIILYFVCIRS